MQQPSQLLYETPFIAYYEQLVTPSECRQLIDLSRKKLQPATVMGKTNSKVSAIRKSENTWFNHDSNEVVRQICERISATVDSPLNYAEKLQVARYTAGGKFNAHVDCFDPWTQMGRSHIEKHGQRLITALLYLNNVDSGGATLFPRLNISVTPSEGRLLVFENCTKGTNRSHLLSLHEGCLVNEGEKWIATLWFHEKAQY
ncbi:2OG-Fe(II) oxygenase [Bacillaceae bacterium SAS-127]|nr:2OG-Fe(II) oxygenase [Bacillaceae bacterium SAS-127]